jgi:hypothetical protein
MLYDNIEKTLGTKLRASGWLSFDAYHFWQKRDPSVVQWHLELEHLSGLWVSPKQLLNLKAVTEIKLMDAIENHRPTGAN